MTVSNITVLSLLGKDVSFSVLLSEQKKPFFPNGIQVSGTVEEVIIALNGNHQILVCDEFYSVFEVGKLMVTSCVELVR